MSSKERAALVPKLRFPDFLDAERWVQKSVEDFFNVGSSKRVLQQDWTTHGIPFYRTRELVSLGKSEPFASEIFIAEKLFCEITDRYGAPKEGDFLVSGVGTLGISYLVRANDKFYFKDGNVLWFETRGGISSTYFKYCFESDVIQTQILKQASVSTVGTYTIQNAKTTKFFLPPSEREQQKIADCLSSLDELIAAQARKVDALKTHKKGLMQQLFPREGETQPRLRFPEFRDAAAWKRVPLGSLCVRIMDGTHFSPKSKDGPRPYLTSKNIREGRIDLSNLSYISEEEHAEIYSKCPVKLHDVLLTKDGANTGNCTLNDLDFEFSLLSSVAVLRGEPRKLRQDFLFQSILSDTVQSLISESMSGQAITRITLAKIGGFAIPVSSLSEQQRIADCLTSLDNLITAATRELEALRTHKKGLMQQLFPALDETSI